MVIMTRDTDVEVARGLRGREDREQHRYCAPVGEEVALIVVRPWVLAIGEVALHILRKRELVAVSVPLAEPSLGCRGSSR